MNVSKKAKPYKRKPLGEFAYLIKIQWWISAIAGLIAIGIALFTISIQSAKKNFREFVKYNLPILLAASHPRCGKFFSEFIPDATHPLAVHFVEKILNLFCKHHFVNVKNTRRSYGYACVLAFDVLTSSYAVKKK